MLKLGTVVFATDFSDCSDDAFDDAVLFAKEHDAELHVVHAIVGLEALRMTGDTTSDEERVLLERLETEAREMLDRITGSDPPLPLAVRTVTRHGDKTSDVILAYLDEVGADALVLGTHGRRGPGRWVLGSVAEAVLRGAECPVLVVPRRQEGLESHPVDKILVPIDFSQESISTLYAARELARAYDARLALLHVIDLPAVPMPYGEPWSGDRDAIERRSRDELRALADEAGLDEDELELAIDVGTPSAGIVDYAATHHCRLIVMPARTKARPGLLGSTTDVVLRRATCPVLTLPPRGDSVAERESLTR